jgi:NADPH2:quinone reductase
MVIRNFGPPSVMRLEEVPTPHPAAGEVLIEVHAVTVNRSLDLAVRDGSRKQGVQLPHVLGVDPAGVIVEVGEGVAAAMIGQRVATSPYLEAPDPSRPSRMLGVHGWGGYAEFVRVPAIMTHPIPPELDFVTAAVVCRHGPAAFSLLKDFAQVQPGEWVLVMGASGGLGSAGVQIAKYLGARVIAGAGAPERVEAAVGLGADAGVDYRAGDLAEAVAAITGGRGVDVVFDNMGDPETFPKAVAAMARGGRLVTAGGHAGGVVPLDVNQLYRNRLKIIGGTGFRPEYVDMSLQAAAEGRLKALVSRVLPLAEASFAHTLVAEREGVGKVVLTPAA